MPKDQNFENNKHEFNIHLEENADLNFKADGKNGNGNTRMAIIHDTAQLAIGGTAGFPGRVTLHDPSGATTVDLNAELGHLTLGSFDGQDDSGHMTLLVGGGSNVLQMIDSSGNSRVLLDGSGRLELQNQSERVTAELRGDSGRLTLGGANATDGDIHLLDDAGGTTITCNGQDGKISCTTLTATGSVNAPNLLESSDERLKTGIRPLRHALDSVLALRGVSYSRDRSAGEGGEQQIGFVGQEVESVYPELVAIDTNGYRSVNYTRMTAVLVEAVKEQQRLIREQAAILNEAMRRIAALEAGLETVAEAP
jgi:hypothetical protein